MHAAPYSTVGCAGRTGASICSTNTLGRVKAPLCSACSGRKEAAPSRRPRVTNAAAPRAATFSHPSLPSRFSPKGTAVNTRQARTDQHDVQTNAGHGGSGSGLYFAVRSAVLSGAGPAEPATAACCDSRVRTRRTAERGRASAQTAGMEPGSSGSRARIGAANGEC